MKKKYIQEIDALRCIAVMLVLLFHFYPSNFPGGYLGVDIFFVISGFVISGAYLKPLLSGESKLTDFYVARIRRLSPALGVVLTTTATLSLLIVYPDDLLWFAYSLAAQVVYAQNFVFWVQGDYFEHAISKPLLHTWSLAVEEQFYIGFAILILIGRWYRSLVLWVIAFIFLLSIFFGLNVAPISPKTSFFLLPARIWQISLGILAYLATEHVNWKPPERPYLRYITMLFVALIVASVFVFDHNTLFPGYNTLFACGFTAISLILFTSPIRNAAFLRARPIVYTGLISYPLYLWHWPIISLASIYLRRDLAPWESTIGLALSFALASLTYHFVETPIRKRRFLATNSQLLLAFVGGLVSVGAVGALLIYTQGAVFRYPVELQPFFQASQERTYYRCGKIYRILHPNSEICPTTDVPAGRGVLILGDSQADMLDEAISLRGERHSVRVFLTVRPCDLWNYGQIDYCSIDVLERIISEIERNNIDHIVVLSFWEDKNVDLDIFRDVLDRLFIGEIDIHLMENIPSDGSFDPVRRVELYLKSRNNLFEGLSLDDYATQIEHQRAFFNSLRINHPNRIAVLSPEHTMCSDIECDYHTNGYPNYSDSRHLTRVGVDRLMPIFDSLFSTSK